MNAGRRLALHVVGGLMIAMTSACGAADGLAAPNNLHLESISDTSALLLWDPVDGATGIRVERRDGADAPFVEVGVTGEGSSGHLNTGLTSGAVYVWRLRACRGDQCSSYSPQISVAMH